MGRRYEERLGRFIIEEPLNDDRSVFRARDEADGARCVVKIPRRGSWSNLTRRNGSQNRLVFAYEADMLQAWNGINGVVALLDRGVEQRTPYFAVEWLGRSLEEETPEEGLDLAASLRVVRDLAEPLAAIHAGGWAHYDIKPANALWSARTRRWTLIDPAPRELFTDAYLDARLPGAARDVCALARTFLTAYIGFEETAFDDEYAEVLEETQEGTRFVRVLHRGLRDGSVSARELGQAAATLLAIVG